MNARKISTGLLTTLILSGCVNYTPNQIFFNQVHNDFKPMRPELTEYDRVVAQSDCQVETMRYRPDGIIGDFGGRDSARVYLTCLKDRGWLYSGENEFLAEMVK